MTYLLVDANHLASRCRHAGTGQQLTTGDGRRSGVVFGTLRSLSYSRNLLKLSDSQIICCWDYGRAAGRLDLFPDYKSGRRPENPTEEEIAEQRSYYEQLDALLVGLRTLGIRSVRVSGCEADDLIAVFAHMYASAGHDVVVHSGDFDLHQLVSSRVKILHPEKGLLSEEQILELWELPDKGLMPIVKAMTGDRSDAIPGAKGIGKKRARLIAPFQYLLFTDCLQPEGVPDATWRWIEKARAYSDIILRNLRLMTLPRTWAESFYTPEQAKEAVQQMQDRPKRDFRAFVDFCREWELTSVLDNLHHWQ